MIERVLSSEDTMPPLSPFSSSGMAGQSGDPSVEDAWLDYGIPVLPATNGALASDYAGLAWESHRLATWNLNGWNWHTANVNEPHSKTQQASDISGRANADPCATHEPCTRIQCALHTCAS